MADIVSKVVAMVVGVIGLVIVAIVIDSETNAAILGNTANTVIGFVPVGLAIGLLVLAFSTFRGTK